jgi:hypothetical protein
MLEKAEAVRDPFEQSLFMMVHLPYLQPFGEVNKRVSRLAANIPMVRKNLCPLAFVDVEEAYVKGMLGVYELNRIDRSSTRGSPKIPVSIGNRTTGAPHGKHRPPPTATRGV